MQIFHHIPHLTSNQASVVTIGMFDGVHIGHQRLIRAVVNSAKATGRISALVTFYPHPATVFGRVAPVYLTSNEEKLHLIELLGIELIVILKFTSEFALVTADSFVTIIRDRLHMNELWLGKDAALGYQRKGTPEYLQALGLKQGFALNTVEPVELQNQPVSSTRIRAALHVGDIQQVNDCLGRLYKQINKEKENSYVWVGSN